MVVDEADVFFEDEQNFRAIKDISQHKDIKGNSNVQWILFSATLPDANDDKERNSLINKRIYEIFTEANQVRVKTEKLKLDHVKQFRFRCDDKKKLDFIKDVFEICDMTQTFIFVNSKDYAERIHNKLRAADLKSYIMFSKMSHEERDSTMERFRNGEINVLISTNVIARGIDVPLAELVINYDVPTKHKGEKGPIEGDPETYLHRIGRTGRFGGKGIALTIYDRNEDEKYLDQILNYYNMKQDVKDLESPEQLRKLLEDLIKE